MISPAGRRWAPLTDLEIAAGITLDEERPGPLPVRGRCDDPRTALEHLILGELTTGRASVTFSGGRDSSLLLAVACRVARREGLPEPVALTMRHRAPESREDHWQEMVVRHLGLSDWVRMDVTGDVDLLGDTATAELRRTGVQAPPNAYLHGPPLDRAPSGTLLTGAGGDEVLGTRAKRLTRVLARRTRPMPRDLAAAAFAVAPRRVRRRREAGRSFPFSPWLTPEARDAVQDRLGTARTRYRLRWDQEVRDWARSRTAGLARQTLADLAGSRGKRIVSPLGHPDFVDAFARAMGPAGPVNRSQAVHDLAGDLLPPEIVIRTSKASFGGWVWGQATREFIEGFDLERLRPGLRRFVDLDVLRTALADEQPPYTALMLVQAAWLDSASRDGAEGRQDVLPPGGIPGSGQ